MYNFEFQLCRKFVFLDLKFRWASFQYHCCLCDFLWFFNRAFENIFFFICPPLLYYWHGHCHIILNVLCLIPRCCFLRTSPPNYLHQNVHVECWPYFCPLCTFRRKMGHVPVFWTKWLFLFQKYRGRLLVKVQGDQDHFYAKEMLISLSILKLRKNPWKWEGLRTIHFI